VHIREYLRKSRKSLLEAVEEPVSDLCKGDKREKNKEILPKRWPEEDKENEKSRYAGPRRFVG
jgi:hypothetical protein